MPNPPNILSHKDPFFGLRILQPSEDPSLPPKRILNYKDGTELVYIPPGPFMMGDDRRGHDRPRHGVYLDGYYMAVWPVTNKQYRRFMRETGHRAPEDSSAWEKGRLNVEYMEHPVVCVSWEEAEAYAEWATLRLPTEAEWDKAAGGPEGLKYPWGNQWEKGRYRYEGNRGEGTTAEVKEYVSGVSVYGCEQMYGNVWEWCRNWCPAKYTFTEVETRNPVGPETGDYRVVRGSSWRGGLSHRDRRSPEGRYVNVGFRLARSFP